MQFLLLFSIFFGCLNLSTSAQVIRLDSNKTYQNLGKQVRYFEDKGAGLSLSQVKALEKAGKFKRGKSDILNLGNTPSAFWIKLNYLSTGGTRAHLIIDLPNIEHIDCYIPTEKGIEHRKAGTFEISEQGTVTTNNYVFNLPQQAVSPTVVTIWLRIKTDNFLLLPIKMATSENFVPGTSLKNSLENIYIGILLTILIFNIFLYLSVKDKTYLYYSLYVLPMAIYVVGYSRGYGYLLGHDFRILLNHYPHALLSLALIASILFAKKFLNLQAISSKYAKICDFLIVCSIIMFFTSITGYKSLAARQAQYLSMANAVILWTFGMIAYLRGHKPAKYYILARTSLAIAVIAVVFSLEGIFPYNDYTFEFVPIGSTIEVLLLAFALGNHYRTILQNEERLLDENLSLIQTQNQRLERVVEERTVKLSETIAQLEASNGIKNKLFSIIAHDLRSPFNSLISIFSLKDMDLLTLNELKMLLNENRKNIDTIHITLNNLLHWAQSQMEGLTTHPAAFNLKLLTEDLLLVYLPLIKYKEIAIELHTDEHTIVYADENQIQLVLRNLIDNAIKFTAASESIQINLASKADHIEIRVSNPISDANRLNLENINNPGAFEATYGTGQERGMGLGLDLCREYIKINGGNLEITVIERLVSFCFQLPRISLADTIPA